MSLFSDNDPDVFWGTKELKARGIITNTTDLWVKQQRYGFPKGVILGGKRRFYRAVLVRQWLALQEVQQGVVVKWPPDRELALSQYREALRNRKVAYKAQLEPQELQRVEHDGREYRVVKRHDGRVVIHAIVHRKGDRRRNAMVYKRDIDPFGATGEAVLALCSSVVRAQLPAPPAPATPRYVDPVYKYLDREFIVIDGREYVVGLLDENRLAVRVVSQRPWSNGTREGYTQVQTPIPHGGPKWRAVVAKSRLAAIPEVEKRMAWEKRQQLVLKRTGARDASPE